MICIKISRKGSLLISSSGLNGGIAKKTIATAKRLNLKQKMLTLLHLRFLFLRLFDCPDKLTCKTLLSKVVLGRKIKHS